MRYSGDGMIRLGVGLLLSALAGLAAAQPASADRTAVRTIDDTALHNTDEAADALLGVYDRESALIIGELHGTVETPLLVSALVGRLAASGPVTLGLEVTTQEQARIDAFLDSDGSESALATLLAGEFWSPSANSDGRRSEAMVAMFESLRERQEETGRVRVVALDNVEFFDENLDRDAGLAESIDALAPDLARGPVIVVMGNYHARATAFSGRLIANGEEIDPIVPAASLVAAMPVTSVNVSGCRGEFWACPAPGDCGPQPIDGQCPAPDSGVLSPLDPDLFGYHWSLLLPVLTASPPSR